MDRQLLARATENSDAPTPGYMYLDIAKNAASNPAICADIAKYLTNRLASKQNANVKFKCLKVIAKTCTSPYLRGQFKRCLAQDPSAMTAIKEAIQFRGPPDPVRGDEPYERVRNAAKEALDAVYSDTPQDQGAAPFTTSLSSTGSYGQPASSSMGGGGGGMTQARRMEGIGNPMFSDPRLEPQTRGIGHMTASEVLSEARETVIGMIKDPLARNVTVQPGSRGAAGYGTYAGGGGGGSYGGPSQNYGPPGRNELMQSTGGQWTMASNRGPSAVNPPPNFHNDASYYKSNNSYGWAQSQQQQAGGTVSSGVGGSWAAAAPPPATSQPAYNATPSIQVTSTAAPAAAYSGGGGTAVADGSYERQLILELCPPGGMKAEPPPDKLNQFARLVSSLNPDLVCPVLLDCLEEGQPWIIRAKALCVMESCIQNGQKPGSDTNAYSDFFHACSGEVAPLVNHSRLAIREPAKRVMQLLGVATPTGAAPTAPAAAPPAAAPSAPTPNLLDFDDDTPSAPPPAAAPPAPSGQNEGGASLFGGLNVTGNAAAAAPSTAPAPPSPPPSSGNLLGDWDGAAASDSVVASSNGDLFGDMMVKPNASASAPAASANQSAPAAEAPTSNIAGNVISGMFDNMSLKSTDDAASASGGSAFGFINQSASTDSATEKKVDPPQPPAATSRDSFDPLKNVTPQTAQKMMQVSPEQMQAMMYQHMMMQQQQQMAHMRSMQQHPGAMMPGMMTPNMFRGGFHPNMGMMNHPGAAAHGRPARVDDKRFDFVQDAMSMEKKK